MASYFITRLPKLKSSSCSRTSPITQVTGEYTSILGHVTLVSRWTPPPRRNMWLCLHLTKHPPSQATFPPDALPNPIISQKIPYLSNHIINLSNTPQAKATAQTNQRRRPKPSLSCYPRSHNYHQKQPTYNVISSRGISGSKSRQTPSRTPRS